MKKIVLSSALVFSLFSCSSPKKSNSSPIPATEPTAIPSAMPAPVSPADPIPSSSTSPIAVPTQPQVQPTPNAPAEEPVNILKLTSRSNAHCALIKGGQVKCWGNWKLDSEISTVPSVGSLVPVDITFPGAEPIKDIASADVLTFSGKVFPIRHGVEGINIAGDVTLPPSAFEKVFSSMVGGVTVDRNGQVSPNEILGVVLPKIRQLSAGNMPWACWLTVEGAVGCAGSNGYGASHPVISDLPPDIQTVEAGADHLCALSVSGGVWCWGGNTSTPAVAKKVQAIPGKVVSLSSAWAADSSYALTLDGKVFEIQTNFTNELRVKQAGDFKKPMRQISTNYNSICGIDMKGSEVLCFGENDRGQLGNGTKVKSSEPVQTLVIR